MKLNKRSTLYILENWKVKLGLILRLIILNETKYEVGFRYFTQIERLN